MATTKAIEQIILFYKLLVQNDLINKVDISDREKNILEMRVIYAYSFVLIGKQLGISGERARRLFFNSLEKLESYRKIYFNSLHNLTPSNSLKNTVIIEEKSIIKKAEFVNSFAELATKTKKELARHEVFTLQDLAKMSKSRLLKTPKFGQRTVEQLEVLLNRNNLCFLP